MSIFLNIFRYKLLINFKIYLINFKIYLTISIKKFAQCYTLYFKGLPCHFTLGGGGGASPTV